ncbi:hypothetical protein CY34DRAFT_102321, partial [Suillus luteus UH-Slu-Lm8-n1]
PACLAAGEILGGTEVKKVLVICKNNDRMGVSFKIVAPCFQSTDNSEKFPIIDLIVTFGGIKRLGKIPARVIGSIFISLEKNCSSGYEGSIGGKGELARGIRVSEDRIGTCLGLLERSIFSGKVKQGSGEVRVMGDEMTIEVAETKEGANFFYRSWCCPIAYAR